jgi:hypothetical protein
MSCERYTSAIVDHACGAEIAADAAAHLRVCAACRRMFDEQVRLLQDLDQQLELALKIEPSARFVPEVLARVERSAFPWRKAIWWSGAAAAAAVLMLVTFGSLRSGDRHDPAILSSAPSAPVADHPPSQAAPSTRPGPKSRQTDSRRRVDRPQDVVERPRRIEVEVVVPVAQSRAIARYLALVRRGAIDTSALASPEGTGVVAPTDLVIAPLSVEALAETDVERGIGPDADRRGPGTR